MKKLFDDLKLKEEKIGNYEKENLKSNEKQFLVYLKNIEELLKNHLHELKNQIVNIDFIILKIYIIHIYLYCVMTIYVYFYIFRPKKM